MLGLLLLSCAAETQQGAPWNLDMLDGRRDGAYHYQSDGAGTHIYMLDSGLLASVPELQGRAHPQNSTDCNGHGTFVASVAAGTTYGVAKAAQVHLVRVLQCDGTGDCPTLEALDLVLTRPAVVLAAISFSSCPDAMPWLEDSEALVLLAAGNFDTDACATRACNLTGVLCVGALDSQSRRWSGSDYGACVGAWAPGAGVSGEGLVFGEPVPDVRTGTSVAAGFAAGLAAVLMQGHPEAAPEALGRMVSRALQAAFSHAP